MINMTVKGIVKLETVDGFINVEIDGEFFNSGCQDQNLVNAIGYKTIVQVSENYELLKHFSDEELIDEICNNNDRNLEEIIKQLQESINEDPDIPF